MEKLKDSMNQLQQLEQQIYTVDCKLGKLVKENARFTQVSVLFWNVYLSKQVQ